MNNRLLVQFPEDEAGIERTLEEAIETEKQGIDLAYDLTWIKDRKRKVDIIMALKDK